METLNGLQIKRQDLKEEGGNYIFFIQLKELAKKNSQEIKFELTDRLFTDYDSLIVLKDDEIAGMKGDEKVVLDKIKGAYNTAQSLFIE